MKNLVFILTMMFCLMPGQVKSDSISLAEKVNKLDELTKETKALMQKAEKVEKKKENLIYRLKMYILSLTENIDQAKNKGSSQDQRNKEATKVENKTDPVTEIDMPLGVDSIRGGWLYRLFHKDDIIIRRYKIENNEKIYLD
jgi:hypothetical protein